MMFYDKNESKHFCKGHEMSKNGSVVDDCFW